MGLGPERAAAWCRTKECSDDAHDTRWHRQRLIPDRYWRTSFSSKSCRVGGPRAAALLREQKTNQICK